MVIGFVVPFAGPFLKHVTGGGAGFGIVLLQMIANTQNDEIIAPVLDELLLLENTAASEGGLCDSAVI